MTSVYVITEACVDVKDQSCVEVCPADCIHTTDDDRMCFIDPAECIGCDLCRPACPVGAIFTVHGSPAAPTAWVAVNARWFHDATATRAEVDALVQ